MKNDVPPHDATATVIDPSKSSPGESRARVRADALREAGAGFSRQMFMGRFVFSALHPFPPPRADERDRGEVSRPATAWVECSKWSLGRARHWAAQRGVDGAPRGRHAAVAEQIARMTAETFAMETMELYAATVAEGAPDLELQLDALLSQLWTSARGAEHLRAVREMIGEHGEAAASAPALMAGDAPVATASRASAEYLRLAIASEVLAAHEKIVRPMLEPRLPPRARFEAVRHAAWFYARWYSRQWLGPLADFGLLFTDLSPRLASPVRWAAWASHRLARALLHARVVHGAKLEREEILLGRFVEMGAELFAVAIVCSRAQALRTPAALELGVFFAQTARLKVERLFHELHHHVDRASYRVAQSVLTGRHAWLETGRGE